MNVLVDTNVVLDAMAGRVPYKAAAERIFLLAGQERISAFITATSVTDIYYLLNKHIRDDAKVREMLTSLFALFSILEVTESDCGNALLVPMGDYEDALLATCAKRNKIELIITRNLKDFDKSPVKAIEPNAFLGLLGVDL